MSAATLSSLAALRIVPVVEIDDAAWAVDLADALTAAGLPGMEVTLRTPAALDAIELVARERPGFLIGAGTMLTPADVAAAASAGAAFLVSPGRTPGLSSAAEASGLPLIPGAVTASEIMGAVDAGHTVVKFFPAAHLGGPPAIAALAAPLKASGVRFMPTGGISPENAADYLELPSVLAVGGTWIAPRDLLREGRFDVITTRATEAIMLAGSISDGA